MSNNEEPKVENQTQSVSSFHAFTSTDFHDEVNAICWDRELVGDFEEIVNSIELEGNIKTVTKEELYSLELSEQGKLARTILINDLESLEDYGGSPILNLIKHYDRDLDFPFFPTDVYSFHVDRSPLPVETILCTYFGDASEIIPNSQVTQKILIPEIREELKKLHDGPEQDFESFLSEYFFDLHYQTKPNATPLNLGNGHLWKLAIDHPESKVLPCVHRAPKEQEGLKRLMIIC